MDDHFLPAPAPPKRLNHRQVSTSRTQRIQLIGGIPLPPRFRQTDPISCLTRVIAEEGRAQLPIHPAFLPGRLGIDNLLVDSTLFAASLRAELRGRPWSLRSNLVNVMEPVSALSPAVAGAQHTIDAEDAPAGRFLDDHLFPEAGLLAQQYPFPAVALHKPFGSKPNSLVPMDRLHVLDRLVCGPVLVAMRHALARCGPGSRLLLGASFTLSDVANELRRLVREPPSSLSSREEHTRSRQLTSATGLHLVERACGILKEASDASTLHRTASASMVLRGESSSFGRFFTLPSTLAKIADTLVRRV